MTFGEKLQVLRNSKGLSQEKLAAKIKVSKQVISEWELGESNPNIENILLISRIFNITTDYLMKDDEQSSSTDEDLLLCNKKTTAAQILLIASVIFLAIGLFYAFAGWSSEQTADAIWGGMIIQVVGVVAYCIGRVLLQSKTPLWIKFSNLTIGLVIPISMITSLLWDHIIAPYQTDIYSVATFGVIYITVVILCYIIIKRQRTK